MNILEQQFFEALQSVEIAPLSSDYCAKLLVWLYVYGGSCEAVTHNQKMILHIEYAQKKANIYGGEIPNEEMANLIKKYFAEIKANVPNLEYLNWVLEIPSNYQIKMYSKIKNKP